MTMSDIWNNDRDVDTTDRRTADALEALAAYRASIPTKPTDTRSANEFEPVPYRNLIGFFVAANSARAYPVQLFVR